MAYQQQYEKLVTAMLTGETLEPGIPPEDLGDNQLSLIPGVLYDGAPAGKIIISFITYYKRLEESAKSITV